MEMTGIVPGNSAGAGKAAALAASGLERLPPVWTLGMMKVLERIKANAVCHGPAEYDFQVHRWSFPRCSERKKGVYVFVSEDGDILKIGKSDGQSGIAGRLNQYRANSARFLLNPSSSASVIKRIQETDGRRARMEIYYIPIEPMPFMVAGMQIMISPARELEHALATQARLEGHSLRFSPNI